MSSLCCSILNVSWYPNSGMQGAIPSGSAQFVCPVKLLTARILEIADVCYPQVLVTEASPARYWLSQGCSN